MCIQNMSSMIDVTSELVSRRRGELRPLYTMNGLRNLPANLEENLAKTVEHVYRQQGFPSSDLSSVLQAILKSLKLGKDYSKIISNPKWVKGFCQRWGHKIFCVDLEDTEDSQSQNFNIIGSLTMLPTSSSISEIVEEPLVENLATKTNHQKGSVIEDIEWSTDLNLSSPQQYREHQYSSNHVPKSKVLSNMRHHISSKNAKRRKWEDDTYDSCSSESDISDDMYAKKKSGLKYQVPCWSEDTDEESSEEKDDCIIISCSEKENSDEDSSPNEQDTTKLLTPGRADLGLRKKIKPVERFQAGMFKSKKKKKAKFTRREVFESSSCEVSSDEESLASISDNSKENQMEDRDEMNFKKVMNGTMKIEDICLACGTTEEIVAKHPLFIGGLCKEHEELFHEWFFKYDSDGYHSCCSVCCMGSKLVLCDIKDCLRCYCKNCLDSLVHQGRFDEAVQSKHWVCDFCKESEEGVLKKRPEWQHEIQRLYQCKTESKFPPFQVPPPMPVQSRRPIRVLSLFDGIATGIVALKQLGLEIGKFVASEINEDAIRLVQNKHPEVVHVGDITKLTDDEIYKMGPFDLLLGGSPCNDLSGANPRRRGLLDAEGSGCLFFDFYRVLRTVEPPRSQQKIPFFWLFENVVSMKGIEKQRISRFLQCEAKMADARNVSAAARPRLFWGNIPGLKDRKITPGINDKLTVQECLESGRTAMVKQLNTITTKYTCLYQGQARQAPVKHGDKEDVLWTTEVERIFGVPEHYTDVNNLGPRERLTLLGRSWSVPVVRLLLSPLKEYFSGVKVENNPSCSWWR